MTKANNKNNMTKFFQSLSTEQLESWIRNMDTPLNKFLDAYREDQEKQNISQLNMIIAKGVLSDRRNDEK